MPKRVLALGLDPAFVDSCARAERQDLLQHHTRGYRGSRAALGLTSSIAIGQRLQERHDVFDILIV
jgi:hypothetical protein